MRRTFIAILAALSLFAPYAPAQAVGAPVLANTTAAKTRIDSYVKYMNDQTVFKTLVIDEAGGAELTLRNGLFPYVEDWVGVFQGAQSADGIPLSGYAVIGVSSPDSDFGEAVNGFYNYCSKHKDFLVKAQQLADRVLTASSSDFADAATQQKLSEIMGAVAAIAHNSMTVSLAAALGGTSGNVICAKAVADIYYAFRHPPSGTTYACMANRVLTPSKDPADEDGTCRRRRDLRINIGTMPNCVMGDACKAEVETCSQTGCTYYSFRPVRAAMDANLTAYEKVLADEDKKFAEIGGALEKAGADAGKLKADLQARGTALSLPLPLSDITLEGVFGRVINALLGIVGAIALLMFVWGGVTWMTAAGSQEKVSKAKTTITWAAIGLIAIFSSYAILNLLISTFS